MHLLSDSTHDTLSPTPIPLCAKNNSNCASCDIIKEIEQYNEFDIVKDEKFTLTCI